MKTTPIDGYRSPKVQLDYLSDLEPAEAESLTGKTIARIEGREYQLRITFTDGSLLEVDGHTYADSALRVRAEIIDEPEE